jgi:hypothetical protein
LTGRSAIHVVNRIARTGDGNIARTGDGADLRVLYSGHMKPLSETIKPRNALQPAGRTSSFVKTEPTAGTGHAVWEAAAVKTAIVTGRSAAGFFVDMIRNSRNFRPTHT